MVLKENAILEYTGDTSVIALNPINLSVEISEEDDGSPGDLSYISQAVFEIPNASLTVNGDIVDGIAQISLDGLEEGQVVVGQ